MIDLNFDEKKPLHIEAVSSLGDHSLISGGQFPFLFAVLIFSSTL